MERTKCEKHFNAQGPCITGRDYMVDISAKLDTIVKDYIEPGKYFVINRGRQYGKTTTLAALWRLLKDEYLVFDLSFEAATDYFKSEWHMCEGLRRTLYRRLKEEAPELADIFGKEISEGFPRDDFIDIIRSLCKQSPKKVIVTIDEVDRATDYTVFRNFLAMLRDMYIERSTRNTPAFHNVILAGVHDIRNLKKKIRPEEQATYNSPWNIAVPFTLDMSFSPAEIATMLTDYENDHHTGMDISKIAERIYYYTSGYPVMVSSICIIIDKGKHSWTIEDVDNAVRDFLAGDSLLFDDMIKNFNIYPGFAELTKRLLFQQEEVTYEDGVYEMDLGLMFGIFKNVSGKIDISNKIFRTKICNYFIALEEMKSRLGRYMCIWENSGFVTNGELNMRHILERFNAFMKAEYRNSDEDFIEREGRLIFLGFLRGIINGTGNYAVESETSNYMRMDVTVFYLGKEYVLELKIWHGEKKNDNAVDQIIKYLKARSLTTGYLLSFAAGKQSPKESQIIEKDGFTIYEEIVAYRAVEE
ncbi:MAG: AAA-like domain-containing protein [Spirochaetaceae bacterium]|jgi:hypothetical protein|nr:AAA-like domain-containing protein [Spirochaetaceae bacterium]